MSEDKTVWVSVTLDAESAEELDRQRARDDRSRPWWLAKLIREEAQRIAARDEHAEIADETSRQLHVR